MMTYKFNSFYFIVLIFNFMSACKSEYEFHVEWVKSISYVYSLDRTEEEPQSQDKLNELNPEEQLTLCKDVVKHVPLDNVDRGRILFGIEKYEIVHLDGKMETVNALRCPTKPLSYIRSADTDYVVKISIIDEFLSCYGFELQTVKHISAFQDTPKEVLRRNDLYNLTREGKSRLCMGAKIFASANGMDEDSIVDEIKGYEITHLDESKEVFVALQCPTSPPLFLRNGVLPEDVRIMSEIEFLEERFVFNTQTVESVDKLDIDNKDSGEKSSVSYLSILNGGQRWNLCIAGWTHLRDVPFRIRWNPKKPFENIEIYNVVYSNGRTEQRVAFACPTTRENVMFVSSENSQNEFKIMYLKNAHRAPWVWDGNPATYYSSVQVIL